MQPKSKRGTALVVVGLSLMVIQITLSRTQAPDFFLGFLSGAAIGLEILGLAMISRHRRTLGG